MATESGSLLLSSVVLAEVRSFFTSDEEGRKVLHELDLQYSPLREDAVLLVGKIFRTYRKEGGLGTTILPDFLVATHAATQADTLATKDRGYLRTYFPKFRLLSPG